MLMVLKPLISVFSLEETFGKTLQIQELRRQLSELNMKWEGLEELGTKKVEEAWEKELEAQMGEAAKHVDLNSPGFARSCRWAKTQRRLPSVSL